MIRWMDRWWLEFAPLFKLVTGLNRACLQMVCGTEGNPSNEWALYRDGLQVQRKFKAPAFYKSKSTWINCLFILTFRQ